MASLPSGARLPIEVELASKSKARLEAVLALHVAWVRAGKSSAVIYVCGSRPLAERVESQAAEVGLAAERNTLRVELLDTIREQAARAGRVDRAAGSRSAAAADPVEDPPAG